MQLFCLRPKNNTLTVLEHTKKDAPPHNATVVKDFLEVGRVLLPQVQNDRIEAMCLETSRDRSGALSCIMVYISRRSVPDQHPCGHAFLGKQYDIGFMYLMHCDIHCSSPSIHHHENVALLDLQSLRDLGVNCRCLWLKTESQQLGAGCGDNTRANSSAAHRGLCCITPLCWHSDAPLQEVEQVKQ